MRTSIWLLAAGAACLGLAAAPAAAGDSPAGAASAISPAPRVSTVPGSSEVQAVVLAAMAAAADQTRGGAGEPQLARQGRSVSPADMRATMIDAARTAVARRWNGTIYDTPEAEAIKICFGKACFNIKISIHIESI